MEPTWNDIEIRYCPVVGHNVPVQAKPPAGIRRDGPRCLSAERCRAERGGCRNQIFRDSV